MKILISTLTAGLAFVGAANAAPVTVDFNSDSSGAIANGFVSSSSALVSFTDTNGSNLRIGNYGSQSGNSNAIAIFGDDASALQMDFTTYISSISFDFGNDDPGFMNAGDGMWIEAFRDGVSVGSSFMAANLDDIMNQTASFSGAIFNQVFAYYGDGSGNRISLIEVIDNIQFTAADPVPLPAAALMFPVGIAALRAARGKKSAKSTLG